MIVFCSDCNAAFDSGEMACPKCGSKNRTMKVADSITMYESRLGVKDESLYSGKRKFFIEITERLGFDHDTQQKVTVTRKYNRLKESSSPEETYIEEIRATDGVLIKKNTDKLKEHKRHGSDQKNMQPKNTMDGDDNV